MSTMADVGMKERLEEKGQREELARIVEAMPLLEVLGAVRTRIQQEGLLPREKAILTRYVEDAIAWTYVTKSEILPPLPR